jgi:hypothetical protein
MSSTTSSPASLPCSRLHLLVYSDNRGLHRHPLPLCASQPSWRPSLLVSSPIWREVVSTGPVLRTPGTGNTGACLRPRRVPESGKLGRSASSPCSSSRTRFWHNRSMPLSPTCAWFALLDDCLDASPSFYGALCACGFICGYLDIGSRSRHRPWRPLARIPRPRLQHSPLSAPSTSAQGLPPCLSSSLAFSTVQASAT